MTNTSADPQGDFASVKTAALHYAKKHNWYVFPAPPGEKKSHKAGKNSNGAKWGMTKDLAEIEEDFEHWPDANVGIPTGKVNGFWVTEGDTAEGHGVDGLASLSELEKKHGPLPQTLTAESPSGSLHYYFKYPTDGREIKNSASRIGPGIDVRGDGGMVIAPPSVRGDGAYRWVNDLEIAAAPEWLIEAAILASGRPAAGNGNVPPHLDGYRSTGAGAELPAKDLAEIELAVKAIPNSDVDWETWNTTGMAIFAATDGKGFAIFDGYSQRSKKYNAAKTAEKWNSYFQSPPTEIGAGSLFYWASEADPNWRDKATKIEGDDTEDDPVISMPVDLWNKFEPPPLPKGLLPAVIEDFAFEQGALMGADPAGLAGAAIAVCSAAIPDFVKLRVKRNDSWRESTRAWVALVGDPSTKKTPEMDRATKQLSCINTEKWRTYLAEKKRYDALDKEEKKGVSPPKFVGHLINDVTVEGVREVLKDNPNGVLCHKDELSGWFGAMDKYAGHRGAMADRAFWLMAYNGQSYSYSRAGIGSGIIENLSISVLGGIQPEPMRKLMKDSVDDGLIQRMIPFMVVKGDVGNDEPESPAAKRYDALVVRLSEMTQPFEEIRFDDEARKIRNEMERKHHELIACEAVNKKLAAHIGKYDGIFARLCLLWHCIEGEGEEPEPKITAATARRVANFLHAFLLPHAMAFYTEVFGVAEDHDQLAAIAGYILAHKLTVLTNRDIQRGDRTMRALDQREADKICQQLDALGWLDRIPGPRPSSPPRWNVNPEVHRRFEDRGRREEERRKRDKEMITEMLSKKP